MKQPGVRVYPRPDDRLWLGEGEYGYDPAAGAWCGRPPGHHAGSFKKHQVTEHEDGTITVHPSILLTDYDEDGNEVKWHGWLKRGVWEW